MTLVLALGASACTVKDPLFCDPTHPCIAPSRPYCDMTGEYEENHIAKTCIASPFDAALPNLPDATLNPANLTVNMDAHAFPDVATNDESFPAQFTVHNTGQLESGPITATIEGAGSGSFLIVPTGDSTDCATQKLAADATCILQVKFKPAATGPLAATLLVAATPGGSVTVDLSGTGLAPGALVVDTAPLDFGKQAIKVSSAPKPITIRNSGGVQVTNLSIQLTDTNYAIASKTCTGTTLAAGATCDINVAFDPQTVGTHPSSLSVTSTQGDVSPQLQGTGTADVKLTKSGTGTGTVTDTFVPAIMSCGTACAGQTKAYSQPQVVLNAVADSNSTFDGWSGDCTGTGSCTLTMDAAKNVTAAFKAHVCTPSTTGCAAGFYTECDANGQYVVHFACGALGCDVGGDACLDIDPANGLGAALDQTSSPATPLDGQAWDFSGGLLLINTDTGSASYNGNSVSLPSTTVTQATGFPSIRAFMVGSIKIKDLAATGSMSLAFVSNADITITGLVDVSANNAAGTFPPGEIASGMACVPDPPATGGGGGAGRATVGIAGGASSGTGGSSMVSTSSGSPLVGGCRGGQGSGAPLKHGAGGAGGGALQLSSRTTINLQGVATIDVGGGGGRHSVDAGAGGGGSAGMIVLDAPSIVIGGSGVVLAAKGGGGGAQGVGATAGQDGSGDASTAGAAGGSCAGCNTGGAGYTCSWNASNNGITCSGLTTPGANAGGGAAHGFLVTRNANNGIVSFNGAAVRANYPHNANIAKRNRTKQ